MNLIDHIGNKVTLWTKEGNAMERRTLITADEMGIVVEPYTDPDDGPLPDQDHEVFVPWNRVKYVDLIKPYELLCDICKNPLGDNGIEFTTDGARHTDCKPVKPPSPDFIARAKEMIAKAKEITDPQRAKVGDVIRHHGTSVEITVSQSDDDGAYGYQCPVGMVRCEHGEYTIVKRAEDRATYCQSCKQVKKHTHPKDGLFVCEECDPSPEDCECKERTSEPSTSELVDMLAKREAISFDELVPEYRDAIIQWEKKTNLWSLHTARFKGPARILVIPE